MQLYATAAPNNLTARTIEVYDSEGRAFIKKTLLNGRVLEWTSPDKSAEEWVAFNSTNARGAKKKWKYEIVPQDDKPSGPGLQA